MRQIAHFLSKLRPPSRCFGSVRSHMWSHQAKAITWVYVICYESVQSAEGAPQVDCTLSQYDVSTSHWLHLCIITLLL